MRWFLVSVLSLVALSGCMTELTGSVAQAEKPREWSEFRLASEVKDARLNESSGIARSYADPGTYLTHNDSGDSARFFRVTLKGELLATYDVEDAKATDWEDIATAKLGDKNVVFLGDIGDNAAKRKGIHVYIAEEPTGSSKDAKLVADLHLRYPDGAHNAETLLANPNTGDVEIVTKTPDGKSGVYRLKGTQKSGEYTLTKVGDLTFTSNFEAGRLTTGGDYSPDGKFVVIRTYLDAHEFSVPADGRWWTSKPRRITTAAEIQGEAIGYSSDGKELITTSEGTPCRISLSALK